MRIEYNTFTDIDMNSILIPVIPEAYTVNDKVKQFFIQGYGDNSFDVIVERDLDSFTMQGCYFEGDSKAVVITGFRVIHRTETVRIHFKLTKRSKSLSSARKAMKKMFTGLIKVKEIHEQ